MTKLEAIRAMTEGKAVTHPIELGDELFMYMAETGRIWCSDGDLLMINIGYWDSDEYVVLPNKYTCDTSSHTAKLLKETE